MQFIKRLFQSLFTRKTVAELTAAADDEEGRKLVKHLTSRDVFFAGIGCIIGAGIFVVTGTAAHDHAGPGIIVSFVLAGFVCAFVSMAYAELASMIPVSGSAYTYAYATLGELLAWIIGWDLLLEYAVGTAAVATSWSEHLRSTIGAFAKSDWLQQRFPNISLDLPAFLNHAPTEVPWMLLAFAIAGLIVAFVALRTAVARRAAEGVTPLTALFGAIGFGALGYGAFELVQFASHITSIDLYAVLIIALLNYWLVKGIKHTARMTSIFVVVKLAVIALFIVLGVTHINPANWTPFLPNGWGGVFTAASIVFFAYIGFDSCTTLAEECVNPQKDVPRGVIASLGLSTFLYIAVAAIMTGILSYKVIGNTPMVQVLDHLGYTWAGVVVAAGAIAGLTSVLVVCLVGQSRILMRMSRDGLIAPFFGRVNTRYGTPTWAIIISGVGIALMSGLLPIGKLVELTNIGTLFAFAIVCVGVMILRVKEPERHRSFRCPWVWVMAPMGTALSLWMMYELPLMTHLRFGIWMAVGLVIYFAYSRRHSIMRQNRSAVQNLTDAEPPQDPQNR